MCDPITALLATPLFTVGTATVTVGGAIGAASTIAGLVTTGISAYQSARASKKAEAAQKAAIEKLSESNSTLEVNKTAGAVSENTTKKRTLSSLRVKQDTDAITSNVYGVDSNNTVSSSSNMVGLNIAA